MAIDAIGVSPTPSYAAVDRAKMDQAKASALLDEHKQCKACPSTIKKDEKAVAEAAAITRAAEAKIQAAMAEARGGVNLLV